MIGTTEATGRARRPRLSSQTCPRRPALALSQGTSVRIFPTCSGKPCLAGTEQRDRQQREIAGTLPVSR